MRWEPRRTNSDAATILSLLDQEGHEEAAWGQPRPAVRTTEATSRWDLGEGVPATAIRFDPI
jgi:hypothetical protein